MAKAEVRDAIRSLDDRPPRPVAGAAGRLYGLRALGLPLTRAPRRATAAATRCILAALGRLVEVVPVAQLAALPEPAIYALNHNNAIESVLVPAALLAHRGGRNIRFAVDWMFLRLPLLGALLGVADPVPVYTKPFRWRLFESHRLARRQRTPLADLAAALAAGDDVGLFPEGTRNHDPERLRRGRPGLGHLVLSTAAPVVPVGISYPATHRRDRPPLLGLTRVRIGEPLGFGAERAALAAGEDRRRLSHHVVAAVMNELAALSGKEPPRGQSPPPTLEAS